VARGVQHVYRQIADVQGLAVAQQAVELPALARHVVHVEHRPKNRLDIADVLADGHARTDACFEVGAALRWSAWAWASKIHTTSSACALAVAVTWSADAVDTFPLRWS